MTEITIRCTNCGLGFESDYDLEQNLIDPETGEIHDGCPTCKTDAYLMDIKKDFIQRLRGRAEFCRDRGEVKTPELLEHAAQLLEKKAQAVQEQVLDAPACVGGGTFQKGVKWSTVIGAAQRHYENDRHHEAPAICIRDQLRVASGHSVVVLKEPTYEMLEAGSEARSRTEGHIASIWEAMIEAQEQDQ